LEVPKPLETAKADMQLLRKLQKTSKPISERILREGQKT